MIKDKNGRAENVAHAQYWKANITLILTLLAVWFTVSFAAGILFVDLLDRVHIFGYPLGFWFAEQGSVYVFIVLIFVYARQMNQLDEKYNVSEK